MNQLLETALATLNTSLAHDWWVRLIFLAAGFACGMGVVLGGIFVGHCLEERPKGA